MSFQFHLKYHSEEWDFALSPDATVGDLEAHVFQLTHVEPSAQKLLGLFNRKPSPPKETHLRSCLGVRAAPRVNKITLMGVTREQREQIHQFEATMVAEREAEREAQAEAQAEAERRAEAERLHMEEQRARALEERRLYDEEHAAANRRVPLRRRHVQPTHVSASSSDSFRPDTDDDDNADEVEHSPHQQQSRALNASFDDDASIDNVDLVVVSNEDHGVADELVGDKVRLPDSVLRHLDAARVRPPFLFRVTNAGRCVHVRALDFTAAHGQIVMSPQLIADLGAESGASVKLESVQLPPATKLQLRPQSSWVDLDPELRDAILHYELRNYATATLGGSLHVRNGNDLFAFEVCDVEPKSAGSPTSAVSLSDVDVEVDVIEPTQLPPPIVALRVDEAATTDCVASAQAPAYFSLVLGEADVGARFRVSVQSSAKPDGDPDIFASQLMKRPSAVTYEWQAQLDGPLEELTFVCGSGAGQVHPSVPLYVAVTAYGSVPCTFSIALRRVVAENRLNDDAAGSGVVDGVKCVTCGRMVPRATLALHELGCQRDNHICGVCNELMPRRSKAKHEAVRHQQVRCSLGCRMVLSQDEQATHRREACRLRAVPCIYCPMWMPLLERGAHQALCCNRTATCKRCEFTSKRKEMKRHVVEEHGVFPKDVRPTDWH
jgi:hypothetical protein